MAVQAEPIAFSGERITIAVAVVGDNGDNQVVRTVEPEPLECAFGRFGKQFLSLADDIVAELKTYLLIGGELSEWQSRFSGIYAGEVVPTRNDSMQQVITSALRHTSLFSAKGNNRQKRQSGEYQLRQFQRCIKEIVTGMRDGYAERFNRQLKIFGKVKTTYGYVGNHVAMNLATIDTTLVGHSQQRDAAIRKLSQLAALRDHAPRATLSLDRLVMGIWVPQRELSTQSQNMLDSYLDELGHDAQRLGIEFSPSSMDAKMENAARPLARVILAD